MAWINIPHLHLLLNHVPTVGSVLGLGLLLLAVVRRSDHLTRASLEVLVVITLLTPAVYFTGVAAKEAIAELDGIAPAFLDAHETAALLAFIWMQITGLAAWLALWQSRRLSHPPRGMVAAALLLSVVTVALMGRAAMLGGEIRHPEILNPEAAAATPLQPGWLTRAGVTDFVQTYGWAWPAAETLHFLGLCLVVGVLLTVNLRILGAMKALPFPTVHRLLPWGMLGFGLNLVTGMLFFIASSDQYTQNVAFHWKVLFLGLVGAHFLYLTVFDKTWALNEGEEAGALDKVVAVAALASWAGVIYWGRMLPYIGNSN